MWDERRRWSGRFLKLFDEEKDHLGDLPREIKEIMDGYFWHYGDPRFRDHSEWFVHDAELTLEAELPNGHIFRGRFDLLVENDFGLWLVDHKSHKKLPDWSHRMFDIQAPLYTWAARESGIPVTGFMWNYLGTSARSTPQLIKDGSRFSKTGWASTDYPSALAAVKAAGWIDGKRVHVPGNEDHTLELRARLKALRDQRWAPGQVPTSPFYRRDELVHTDEQIQRVVDTAARTSERMHSYDYSAEPIERNTVECKGWKCSYQSLSLADLVNGESDRIKKQEYMVGDPLAYYEDETGKE